MPPRSNYAGCATSAPLTNGSSPSTAPATTTTTNQSSPPACPSAPAKTPSTPPAASTSTTQPPGPDPRRTYGSDHLAAGRAPDFAVGRATVGAAVRAADLAAGGAAGL